MTLQEIKTAINNGANWNGKVYGKNVGNRRNNQDLSIYLDGKYIAMGRVFYEDAKEEKAKIIEFLNSSETEEQSEEQTDTKLEYDVAKNNNIFEGEEHTFNCHVKHEAEKMAMEIAYDNLII